MIDYDELSREYVKCYTDTTRIYMIEHYLKTYDMRERKEVPFKLFPRQRDFINALNEYQNNVTTKPRQAGITTTTAAFLACTLALADPDSPETVLVIGNKIDLAQQMVTKIKDFVYQLPRWFFGDDYFSEDPKAEANKKKIFVTQNKSELELFNGSKVLAKSSGENAARGVSSVSWLIFDEAAFIEKGDVVYAQAVATTSTGGHIVMISTPNGKDQLYYKTYHQAKNHENNFHVTELQWFQDPRYNCHLEWYKKNKETGETDIIKEPTIDSKGSIRYEEEHWNDMMHKGYKPRSPWYLNMCGKFNNDEQKIAQELDVSFLGSASNVVDPEFIEMQEKMNVREPNTEYRDPMIEETWVWKLPIPGHRYIMSIDCSRGDAADRTAIEILDMDALDDNGMPTIEQVLEYHGKKTGDDIGEIAYKYGNIYGEAFTVIDCVGGTGDACILTMMRLGYKNLYYDDPNLKTYTIQRDVSSIQLTPDGKLPGFHSSSVRFQMLTYFANMVKTNALKIRSSRVISELETWIYKGEAGRIDHMDGCHDDTLTCLAMAVFVMQFSLNKIQEVRKRDEVLLSSWVSGKNSIHNTSYNRGNSISIEPKNRLPFYSNQTIKKSSSIGGNYMWLYAKS